MGGKVRYAEERGALMLVIHVSMSRAASFEGANALFQIGQARLPLSLGALNFVHFKPSIHRRVVQPLALSPSLALLYLDREIKSTPRLTSPYRLRYEELSRDRNHVRRG